MRKKMEWTAETLSNVNDGKYGCVTERVKVIGGWIITFSVVGKQGLAITSQFIADRDHEWTIIKPSIDPVIEKSKVSEGY